MKMPEQVHRRVEALLAEYGFSPEQVPGNGVQRDGFFVLGEFPERGTRHYALDAVPRTFIQWRPRDVQRAAEAINLDWEETIGPEAVKQMLQLVHMEMPK